MKGFNSVPIINLKALMAETPLPQNEIPKPITVPFLLLYGSPHKASTSAARTLEKNTKSHSEFRNTAKMTKTKQKVSESPNTDSNPDDLSSSYESEPDQIKDPEVLRSGGLEQASNPQNSDEKNQHPEVANLKSKPEEKELRYVRRNEKLKKLKVRKNLASATKSVKEFWKGQTQKIPGTFRRLNLGPNDEEGRFIVEVAKDLSNKKIRFEEKRE